MNVSSLLAEPFPRLLTQISIIILVSGSLGFVVRHQRQPVVIAEIIAGIVLGPSLFVRFAPGG